MKILRTVAVVALSGVFTFGGATAMHAQRGGGGSQSGMGQSTPGQGTSGNTSPSSIGNTNPVGLTDDPVREREATMEAQQAKMRNNERQQKLVDDTNMLLQLASQLKSEVEKTNKDMLSIDVIKKADEIEKLAKSVKDRMKG